MPTPLVVKPEQVIGVLPPPAGVTPNFNNPPSNARPLVVWNIICLLVSYTILFLRLYTRHFIVHLINYYDYAITIAQLLATGFSVTAFTLVRVHGVGVRLWNVRITQLSHIRKLAIVQSSTYWLAVLSTKVSILLFYRGLWPDKLFYITVDTLLGICTVYCLIAALGFLFFCQPVVKYWDPSITHGSCTNADKVWRSTAIINAVTDVAMLVLPIWTLRHIRVPRRQKIGLIAIFMTGVFVTIASFTRLYFQNTMKSEEDHAREVIKVAILGTLELYLGVICSSLPHAKPFLRHHFPKLLGSNNHSVPRTERWPTAASRTRRGHLPLDNEDDSEDKIQLHPIEKKTDENILALQLPRQPPKSITSANIEAISVNCIQGPRHTLDEESQN